MKAAVESMAGSTTIRLIVVTTWTVISTMAYFSRYERMTQGVSTFMAIVVASVSACGFVWAVWPSARYAYKRRRAQP